MKYAYLAFNIFIAACTVEVACAVEPIFWRAILVGCGIVYFVLAGYVGEE